MTTQSHNEAIISSFLSTTATTRRLTADNIPTLSELSHPHIFPLTRLKLLQLRTCYKTVQFLTRWTSIVVFLATADCGPLTRNGSSFLVVFGVEGARMCSLGSFEMPFHELPWTLALAYGGLSIAVLVNSAAKAWLATWSGCVGLGTIAVTLSTLTLLRRPFMRPQIIEELYRSDVGTTLEERKAMAARGTNIGSAASFLSWMWVAVFVVLGVCEGVIPGIWGRGEG